MPTLEITNFNVYLISPRLPNSRSTFANYRLQIVCSVLGGFITLFGLVSYLCKEKFYLSEACTKDYYIVE
jgi:hypothetical protein